MHEHDPWKKYEPGNGTPYPQIWWAHLLGILVPVAVVSCIVGIAIAQDPSTAKKVFALVAQAKR